ncbi:MAG TPA: hypothetical protein VEZ48_10355 [Sphingomonadaceae bacterium]|nr:hypothetical protein [Sphingomonadaceae bacterium]
MSRSLLAVAAALSLALGGCVSTRQVADVQFAPPQGDFSLIVMRPDVTVGSVTMGGLVEPREDWTENARANLLAALKAQQAGRGGRTMILETRASAGANAELVADLERLHNAVGASIQLHKYSGADLPTKRRQGIDWTLGADAVRFGQATGYDYALFMYAEDSFASTGRVLLGVLGTAGCFVGFCAPMSGGRQLAYASLVDLRSGDVVWFNVLQSQLGDIRTREGADQMIERLLGRMKAGRAVRKAAS